MTMKRLYSIMILCLLFESSLGCQEIVRIPTGFVIFYCYNLTSLTQLPDLGLENSAVCKVEIQSSDIFPLPKLAFAKYPKLEFLNLKYIQDLDIEPGAFSGLNLEEMIINHNEFENNTVPKDFFAGVESLQTLSLQDNNIEEIHPSIFRYLNNLKTLKLCENKIEKLQYGTFEKLTNLAYLDISYNKLTTLHQQVLYPMVGLKYLQIQSNQISSFNGDDLTTYLNVLTMVLMNSNPWNCEKLYLIQQAFKRKNISIKDAISFDVENVQGIACTSQEDKSEVQIHKEIVIDPKVRSVLNEDFKKSEFYKFFQKDYNTTNFFKAFNFFKAIKNN